jgi:hypothetical protein
VSTPSSDGRPDEALVPLARALARSLADEEGALSLARMQTLALASRRSATDDAGAADTRIGIWSLELDEDGSLGFVRSRASSAEWRRWADVERIPPKRGRRVVLLGESVARGYLFDPGVTPAAILQPMLPDAELVDLARTDLTLQGLTDLLDGLHALLPDEVVLFAGNNWHSVAFELEEPPRLAGALREGGYAALRKVFLEEVAVPRVDAFLERLASTAAELGSRVVVLVPEFNLADWRGEPSLLCPALPGGANLAWMRARERAGTALAAGDLGAAAGAAAEMVALDGGTGAVGQELLAEVALRTACPAQARQRLEAARDAVFGILVAHSPRCPGPLQDRLRLASERHGFAVVDLPRAFEESLGGELPDRRLFLDYCHLTLEGMRVAMAATARALGGDPAAAAPAVDPETEAVAHLLAAIHNAHYGQSTSVVRHHCSRALSLSRDVSEAMLGFAGSDDPASERWMHHGFEAFWSRPAARRYLAPADAGARARLDDTRLIETMLEALEAAGVPARQRLAAAAPSEPARGSVDLLAPAHRASAFRERDGYSLGPERAYVRALTPRSLFRLVRSADENVPGRLTGRLPGGSGDVVLRVQGAVAATLEIGPRWTSCEVALPLRAGLNQIELEWPLLPFPEGAIEAGAGALERGAYPEVLPAFGELHAFTAG